MTSGVDTTGGTASDTSASGGQESSGGEVEDVPARGDIAISLVEANAGVAVPIGADGEWVGPDGRNAPLVKGRNTAVRIYVDVDEATWIPRDIEARLSIHLPDGTVEVASEIAEIAADSSTTSLQSGFIIGALAEWMVPGALYQVELFEAGTGWEDLPPAESPPSTPPEPDFIGIEDTELTMHVVMVPVDYSGPGCSAAITPDQATLQPYEDSMYQQNPLETLNITWDDPYTVNDLDLTNPNDFFQLLNRAQQYRAQQAPPPNVYYYFLFDNCNSCVGGGGGCLLGVAADIPDDSMAAGSLRVAIGTRFLMGSEVGIETFVHEIGHTQGRRHVTCPGQAAGGPDPSYPYPNGEIGVWGFGVRDFGIREASTHTDYMSYCNPTWVSDWQWTATYNRISTLTEWDSASVGMPEGEEILVGTVNPETGWSSWWTERGSMTTPTDGHAVRFWAGDELLELSGAQINPWSEGPMFNVRAPLPAGYDADVTAVEYLGPKAETTAPRSVINDYRRPDALTSGE